MDSAAHADVGYSTLLRWMKNEHTFYKRFQLDVLEAKAAARVGWFSASTDLPAKHQSRIAWPRTFDPDTWGCATCPRRSAGGRDYEGRDARDPDLTRQAKPEGDDGPDIPEAVCVRIWRIEERDPGMVKPGWSRDDAWAAQNLVMKSYGRRYLKVILGRDLEPGDLEAKPLVVEFEMPDKMDIPRGTYDPDRRGATAFGIQASRPPRIRSTDPIHRSVIHSDARIRSPAVGQTSPYGQPCIVTVTGRQARHASRSVRALSPLSTLLRAGARSQEGLELGKGSTVPVARV